MRFFQNLINSKAFKFTIISIAWAGIIVAFLFSMVMIYLLVMDYFYNEDEDSFNENGEEITWNREAIRQQ